MLPYDRSVWWVGGDSADSRYMPLTVMMRIIKAHLPILEFKSQNPVGRRGVVSDVAIETISVKMPDEPMKPDQVIGCDGIGW